MYNINGLKEDSLKLEQLVEYCKKEQFNLIEIIETNINKKEGEQFNIENRIYKSFWTDIEKDKKRFRNQTTSRSKLVSLYGSMQKVQSIST